MKATQYLSHYIRLFLVQHLAHERGLAENTILAYRDTLKLLLNYCENHLKVKIDKLSCDWIDDEVVRQFLDFLEHTRGCAPSTRNARLAALKTFFRYLGRMIPECLENSRRIDVVPQKKVPHKVVDYLEADEIGAIQDAVDETKINGFRDKAMILLMYNTGARAQEIVDLTLKDLRLDETGSIKLTGKGKKERSCPLWKETIEVLKTYLLERKPKQLQENRLFLNNRGEGLTRFGIRYIIAKYVDKAVKKKPSLKQKKIGPHTIRHTTAMHLLQGGNELNIVRLWLGHASLNTTHMYAEIDMEMKKKILSKTKPPKSIRERKKWKRPKILEWLDNLCKEEDLCEV